LGEALGREVELEYSRRGTRVQLVGGTVEVQVINFTSLEKMSSRSPMERTSFDRRLPGEPLRAFWQARFYDSNVYSRGRRGRS
jgi:hypothetical protein